jgi:hypothetical protein
MEFHYIEDVNPLSAILSTLERHGHRYHVIGHRKSSETTVGNKYIELPETYELIVKSSKMEN